MMFNPFKIGPLGMITMGDGRPDSTSDDLSALTRAYAQAKGHIKPVGAQNYAQATADLQLTPQERALYERHLKNLNGPGGVDNPDGSRSTLYQAGVERNGRTYNIPTVYDGKILPARDAMARAEAAGWDNFPSYGSQAEAEARYQQMHGYMDKDTTEYMGNKASPNARVSRGWDQFAPQSGTAAPMLPTPPTPAPVDIPAPVNNPPPALSPQAMAPSPATPMPTPRPADVPAQPQDTMGWFQRNAAMMKDPSTGAFIDPSAADRAQASGPDVINKLLQMFHQKANA